MSTLAIVFLTISILMLAAALFYVGHNIAKHAEANKAKSYELRAQDTQMSDAVRAQATSVWVALYSQSTSLHNNITNFLRIIVIAALGACITLIANKTISLTGLHKALQTTLTTTTDASLAVVMLVLSLLFLMGPIEFIAYKQRDLAKDHVLNFNHNLPEASMLPESSLPKKYFWFQLAALLCLILGIGLLLLAVSNGA